MNEKRLEEISARLKEINEAVDTADRETVEVLNVEVDELIAERNIIIEGIQSRKALRDKVAQGNSNVITPFEQNGTGAARENSNRFVNSGRTKIAADELRSTLISGGKLAAPTAVSGINDTVGAKHSSILDLVKVVNCEGMGSNKVAYIDEDAEAADTQTEGSEATTKDPIFGYVTIMPETIAVTAQISEQVKKQTPLQYEMKVQEQALVSLRRKAVDCIISKLKASKLNTELSAPVVSSKGTLKEDTLTELVLSYGGDDSVVGSAVLFLNKKDLQALGKIRGSQDKRPVYEIIPDGSNPNMGIIKDGGLSVKYCLCSMLTACTGTPQRSAKAPTMFYGNPLCFELDLFSNYEIKVSEDYAITSLMDTVVGNVELGGDVVAKNGFVALTIPSTT